MNTRQIKSLLHESIENIHDESLLNTIKEIIDRQYTPNTDIKLSNWQIARIEESKKQIEEGRHYSEEKADDIINKWLSE